jgi:hypothetical protein
MGEGTLAKRFEKKSKAFPNKIFLVSGRLIKIEQPRLPKNFFQISSTTHFKKVLSAFLKKEMRKKIL